MAVECKRMVTWAVCALTVAMNSAHKRANEQEKQALSVHQCTDEMRWVVVSVIQQSKVFRMYELEGRRHCTGQTHLSTRTSFSQLVCEPPP